MRMSRTNPPPVAIKTYADVEVVPYMTVSIVERICSYGFSVYLITVSSSCILSTSSCLEDAFEKVERMALTLSITVTTVVLMPLSRIPWETDRH